jgi:hypothetical protein
MPTYYFSDSLGDDGRSATQARDPNTPWKTITKLNTELGVGGVVVAGDFCLLRRGEVFSGTLNPGKNGTSTSPITIGAYDAGVPPKITRLVTLSTWTRNGADSPVYYASLSTAATVVLVNGVKTGAARWPRQNFSFYQSHDNTAMTVTDSALASRPGGNVPLTGAQIVIRFNEWVINTHAVTGHNTSTHTLTYDVSGTGYRAQSGFGYFVQNHVSLLRELYDWWFDAAANRLYMHFGGGTPSGTIQVPNANNVVTCSGRSDITFDGIEISGSNSHAVLISGSGSRIKIINSRISFAGRSAVKGFTTNSIEVLDNEILHTAIEGIGIESSSNAVIRRNLLQDTGMILGVPHSNNDGVLNAINCDSNGGIIEYNRVINTGYIGIDFKGDNVIVQRNFINQYCKLKDDGGAIYSWNNFNNGTARRTNVNRVIRYNIVLNGTGNQDGKPSRTAAHGIYMDDAVHAVTIEHNLVAFCNGEGLMLHNTYNILSQYNRTLGNQTEALLADDSIAADVYIRNCDLFHNIFVATDYNKTTLLLQSRQDDFAEFGLRNHNKYLVPYAENKTRTHIRTNRGWPQIYGHTIESLRAAFGQDANSSTDSPVYFPTVNVLSSVAKFVNSAFSNNIDKTHMWSSSSGYSRNWTSSGGLDGGCLRVVVGTSGEGLLTFEIGTIRVDRLYRLRFSSNSTVDFTHASASLRDYGTTYETLNFEDASTRIRSSRSEHEFVFTPRSNNAGRQVVVQLVLLGNGATLHFDNFTLEEIEGSFYNPSDGSVIPVYNDTETTKTQALAGSYVNANGQLFSGSITLAPFESEILFKTAGAAPLPRKRKMTLIF